MPAAEARLQLFLGNIPEARGPRRIGEVEAADPGVVARQNVAETGEGQAAVDGEARSLVGVQTVRQSIHHRSVRLQQKRDEAFLPLFRKLRLAPEPESIPGPEG